MPLNLYRVMRRIERLTPDQRTRIADGLDTLQVLRDAAGATEMSTQAAVETGLLTEADYGSAFDMAPPERGPA